MQTQRSRPLPRGWWLAVPLVVAGLSCSGSRTPLHPVQGQVTYQGKPIGGALVTFHPKGANEVTAVRPTGLTREDGTFTLVTGKEEGVLELEGDD